MVLKSLFKYSYKSMKYEIYSSKKFVEHAHDIVIPAHYINRAWGKITPSEVNREHSVIVNEMFICYSGQYSKPGTTGFDTCILRCFTQSDTAKLKSIFSLKKLAE